MTLKEFLRQAMDLDLAIQSAMEQIQQIRNTANISKSFTTVQKNYAVQRSMVEKTVEKLEQMEMELNRTIDRYVDTKAEIAALINCLPDLEMRTILSNHYLLGHTWEKVAEECYVSIRTVHNIHNTALAILAPLYYKNKAVS